VDEVDLGFAPVEHIGESTVTWPGTPLVAVLDERSAVIAGRSGAEVAGHWSTSPVFVATARAVLGAFGAGGRS
jgi:hypothetical protein